MIHTLDSMAHGVRFIPHGDSYKIREEWDGAIDLALVTPGLVGDALRYLRDRARRIRDQDRGDKNRATRFQGALHNTIANLRDADDEWVRAQYQVAGLEEVFASDRTRVINRELGKFVDDAPSRDLLEAKLLQRWIEDLEAEIIPRFGPFELWKRIDGTAKPKTLKALRQPPPTDAQLTAEEAIAELRIAWRNKFAPQSWDGDAQMDWAYQASVLESIVRPKRAELFREQQVGRQVAAKSRKKTKNSDVRVLDPKNWIVAEQMGRRGCPTVAPLIADAEPIQIIPTRAPRHKALRDKPMEAVPERQLGVFDATTFGSANAVFNPLGLGVEDDYDAWDDGVEDRDEE